MFQVFSLVAGSSNVNWRILSTTHAIVLSGIKRGKSILFDKFTSKNIEKLLIFD